MITKELPLDTLNLPELVLQWKVMKALGYKSLFDKGFRQELRNPMRKFLYYTLVVEEEKQDKDFFTKSLEAVSDKIGYFSDPDLYKKVSEAKDKLLQEENGGQNEYMDKRVAQANKLKQNHIEATEADKQLAVEYLKKH